MRALSLFFAALVLASCGVIGSITGGGQSGSPEPSPASPDASRQTYMMLAPFTTVRATGPLLVVLRPAQVPSVEVSAPGLSAEEVVVVSQDGTLLVGLDPAALADPSRPPEVVVSLPDLRSLDLSGSARARTGGTLNLDRLTLTVADGGDFNAVLNIDGGVLAEVTGASRLDLDGKAASFEATISGRSSVNSEGMKAGDVRVAARGASTAAVRVSGALGVQASGGSTVRYVGTPTYVVDDVDESSQLIAQ